MAPQPIAVLSAPVPPTGSSNEPEGFALPPPHDDDDDKPRSFAELRAWNVTPERRKVDLAADRAGIAALDDRELFRRLAFLNPPEEDETLDTYARDFKQSLKEDKRARSALWLHQSYALGGQYLARSDGQRLALWPKPDEAARPVSLEAKR